MNQLNKRAFGGLFFLLFIMFGLIFLPARTLNYWQAWVFLAVFASSVLAITLYLMKNDPSLLEKRVEAGPFAEKEKFQKLIQAFAGLSFVAIFILSSLDHRFGWSKVSPGISILGDLLVAAGLYFVFLVFKENSFTSGVIEVSKKQKVITTGPYSLVRHPMYSGAFVMLIGVPLALGSYWGLAAVVPLIFVIILRLFDEEKFLAKNLSGYTEYQKKVTYRLIPFVW